MLSFEHLDLALPEAQAISVHLVLRAKYFLKIALSWSELGFWSFANRESPDLIPSVEDTWATPSTMWHATK